MWKAQRSSYTFAPTPPIHKQAVANRHSCMAPSRGWSRSAAGGEVIEHCGRHWLAACAGVKLARGRADARAERAYAACACTGA